MVHIPTKGIEHHTYDRLLVERKRQRNRAIGNTLCEVQGAVDWINHECWLVGQLGPSLERLFPEEVEGGVGLLQTSLGHILNLLVEHGDEVRRVIFGLGCHDEGVLRSHHDVTCLRGNVDKHALDFLKVLMSKTILD